MIVPQPQDLGGVREPCAPWPRRWASRPRARPWSPISTGGWRQSRRRDAGREPTAVIYQIGGSVSGPGSLADAALVAAGFRNAAADYRLSRGGQVPLELLLAEPPDLLVLSSAPGEYRTVLADNLRHPALQRAAPASRVHRAALAALAVRHAALIDALERLAEARSRLEARGP